MRSLPPLKSSLKVSATSTLGDLPLFDAGNLLTDSGRPWIAGLGEKAPALTYTWVGKRSIGSIVLKPTAQASTPRQAVITSAIDPAVKETVTIPLGGGTISFPSITTTTITITFVKVDAKFAKIPSSATEFIVPMGVQSLTIPALGTFTARSSAAAPFVLPCGSGPTLRVDHTVLQTTVSGTVADVEALRPLQLSVCSNPLPLARGEHLLQAGSADGAFKIANIFMTSGAGQATQANRSTTVSAWTAQHRTVHIDRGPGRLHGGRPEITTRGGGQH